ncbi:sulfatase-like hydrolase/transferase [Bremerella sp. P1]|uniref:sulfatase-like hydrolase/transferase n=1 Tax=Bremerella sp. P1 TaxID=3026424 RepID=UPI002368E2D5|nr:sulfatase-like hydrolase/transferase [Bremerella sp. P1]WDI43756.1 sulfatase-like hydrolase/transferase [Bremerella sp. P1]
MKFPCLILLAYLILLPTTATLAAAGEQRPNVLFIAIDDLNDWVGFLGGHPQALTPNMDRLAARGIVFTNAHCVSPACNPSRAAVFTGQMPWRTQVWSNKSPKLFDLHKNIPVLPDSFREAGYATFGTGKLMHSGDSANKRLFEHSFATEQRWSPLTREQARYTKHELPSKGTKQPRHLVQFGEQQIVLPLNGMPSDRNPDSTEGESFDWGPFDVPDSAMGDAQITSWAIEQLSSSVQKQGPPFFMGVGYYRPHIPLFAPAKYFERFNDAPVKLPVVRRNDLDDLSSTAKRWALEPVTAGKHDTVIKHDQWHAAVKAYLASTTFVDAQIGRLVDALDAGEFGDNTLIVVWSDHGWHLGEKQHWGKWTGWERSTRVPLIIIPPKRLSERFAKPGSRCAVPVSLLDIYPTLLELCDLKPSQELDGESLVPLLHRPDRNSDRVAYTSFNLGNISIRDRRWRLIRYADGHHELYDLEKDPHELTNLAGDIKYEKVIKQLEREIPVEALPKAEQHEFQRLKSRVRRFYADLVYDHCSPLLFHTDFSSLDFKDLSISEDDHYSIAEALPERLEIVDAPLIDRYIKAAKFTVPFANGAFRSELSLPHEKGFQERWYAASIFIPSDWEQDLGGGDDIVMQWHAIPGNWKATYPNVALSVKGDQWYLRRSFGSPQTKPTRESECLGDVNKGKWTRWIFHIDWSPEKDGVIEAWKDELKILELTGPNVYGTIGVDYTPYMKFGIYHPSWKHAQPVTDSTQAVGHTVYFTDISVGSKRANLLSLQPIPSTATESTER